MLLGEQAQAHLDEKAWGDDKGGVFCHNERVSPMTGKSIWLSSTSQVRDNTTKANNRLIPPLFPSFWLSISKAIYDYRIMIVLISQKGRYYRMWLDIFSYPFVIARFNFSCLLCASFKYVVIATWFSGLILVHGTNTAWSLTPGIFYLLEVFI